MGEFSAMKRASVSFVIFGVRSGVGWKQGGLRVTNSPIPRRGEGGEGAFFGSLSRDEWTDGGGGEKRRKTYLSVFVANFSFFFPPPFFSVPARRRRHCPLPPPRENERLPSLPLPKEPFLVSHVSVLPLLVPPLPPSPFPTFKPQKLFFKRALAEGGGWGVEDVASREGGLVPRKEDRFIFLTTQFSFLLPPFLAV